MKSQWTSVRRVGFAVAAALVLIAACLFALTVSPSAQAETANDEFNINDPYIQALSNLTYDQKPPRPIPGVDYGIDPQTGKFSHPKATPLVRDPPNFPGQLDHWDQNSYIKNMELIGRYADIASPGHTWQNIVDFGDRRIMYVYGGERDLKIFDITDPRAAKLLHTKGGNWSGAGRSEEVNPFPERGGFGAASIQWNGELGKLIMVQSFSVARYGVMDDKLKEPDAVEKTRHWRGLKGFRVYEMNGPLPHEWIQLAEVTTDYQHPNAPIGEQQGSGSHDVPAYFGGKYMFLSAAPDASYALTEFPDYLYSAGFQSWDMSDPAHPKFLDQFTALGQIVGDPAHEEAYLMNPRAGNRTSWMGSRMPPFFTKPVEQGGRYAFGGMAGLGLYILDVSDPANMKQVGHVNTAPRFAGTEFDNVDVSQYERTGYVFSNGYPMNDECFEPYKDIFVIDAKDVTSPKVVGKFPRPTPPEGASFEDFCQRRGSFGPKRPGYHVTQPGRWREGIVVYAFYNGGVQMFDVNDPTNVEIAGYYVPRFPTKEEIPERYNGNIGYGIYVEYDRNIVWLFSNNAIYALSSPVLGEPVFGMPDEPWPPRG